MKIYTSITNYFDIKLQIVVLTSAEFADSNATRSLHCYVLYPAKEQNAQCAIQENGQKCDTGNVSTSPAASVEAVRSKLFITKLEISKIEGKLDLCFDLTCISVVSP